MNKETVVRRMTLADAPGVHAIEQATFPVPWSLHDFEKEMTVNRCARYMVAEREGRIIAFAGAWIVLDEAHVTNIAVAADCRRQGVGRAVTQALVQYAANLGVQYMTLEVRRSNEAAQQLYKQLGFVSVGVRKRYYADNGEDAYLMVLEHMPPADPDFEEPETVRE